MKNRQVEIKTEAMMMTITRAVVDGMEDGSDFTADDVLIVLGLKILAEAVSHRCASYDEITERLRERIAEEFS